MNLKIIKKNINNRGKHPLLMITLIIHSSHYLFTENKGLISDSCSSTRILWSEIKVFFKHDICSSATLCYGVVGRTAFFLQHRSGRRQRTACELPLTKSAHAAYKTLLKMDP
jgi:hypothetical protein